MIAISLPQPWAGLVLSGQVRQINARRYTSRRDELMIYACGHVQADHPHRHIGGLMDQTDAYLGLVKIQNAADAYEVDAMPYLGLAWWWTIKPGDMMIDPVGAKQDQTWGETFTVPQEHRDHINPMRLGYAAWWDRLLDEVNRRRKDGRPTPFDFGDKTAQPGNA